MGWNRSTSIPTEPSPQTVRSSVSPTVDRDLPEDLERDDDYRYIVTIGFEDEVDIRGEVEALGGTILQERIWAEWEEEEVLWAEIVEPGRRSWWRRLLARLRLTS
jgi:hypothetical protein